MNEITTFENKTNLRCISAASCHSAVGGIVVYHEFKSDKFCTSLSKLYIPSTLTIDLIFWHTEWIVNAVKYEIMI